MPTELTKEQFKEILLDKSVTTPQDLELFQAIYGFGGHKAYASQVLHLWGMQKKQIGRLNLQIVRLGKRIVKKYNVSPNVKKNKLLNIGAFFSTVGRKGDFGFGNSNLL